MATCPEPSCYDVGTALQKVKVSLTWNFGPNKENECKLVDLKNSALNLDGVNQRVYQENLSLN